MKRCLCIVFLVILMVPLLAFGEVLADNWQDASLGELRNARDQLTNRITALEDAAYAEQAATQPAGPPPEPIVISGSGKKDWIDLTIDFVPSKVIVTGQANVRVEGISLLAGKNFSGSSKGSTYAPFNEKGDFKLAVPSARGKWTLTIEPFAYGEKLPLSGKGLYLSNYLEITDDTELILKTKSAKQQKVASSVRLTIFYLTDGRIDYASAPLSIPINQKGESETKFSLKRMNGPVQYVIQVSCEDTVEWTIEVVD